MLSNPFLLSSAILIGFFSSAHCIGMCGGLATAFTQTLPSRGVATSPARNLGLQVALNTGRLISYALAGLLAGLLSFAALQVSPELMVFFRILLGLMLVTTGLYQLGFRQASLLLEKFGQKGWQRILPHIKRYLPATTPAAAFRAGLFWGWLPCGLVYSALLLATATGNPLRASLFMLLFGLGTLPAMLLAANLAWLMGRTFRAFIGSWLVLLGLWTAFGPFLAPSLQHPTIQVLMQLCFPPQS